MEYQRLAPAPPLAPVVDCYWIVRGDDPEPTQQKIIPDGYPEIIFHLADPYRMQLSGPWQTQTADLLAGQLTHHFFLENTGRSHIIGIKWQPTALAHLWRVPMHRFTNRVADLHKAIPLQWLPLRQALLSAPNDPARIEHIEKFLLAHLPLEPADLLSQHAVDILRAARGAMAIRALATQLGVSERHLEQRFKHEVGLTPKQFARIVRFNAIFELMKVGKPDWMELVEGAGFYDQSHFIRNFRAFTGEEPSAYGFGAATLANFFLQRGARSDLYNGA
jgi:AraC-like DNA-binding protein